MQRLQTVLLIEDDFITNFINSRVIRHMDIADNVEIKKSGIEALQFLGQLFVKTLPCPELILLDVDMPVMNGLEFLEEFRKINFSNKNNVFVSLLTTYHQLKNYDAFIEQGIHTFLNKPLTKDQLIPILKKLLPVWKTSS